MLYNFNFYSSILLIFFSQGILFSFLLLNKSIKNDSYADKLLSLFVFLSAIYILPWMLGFAGWYFVQPYRDIMFYIPMQQIFLLGPLIFFYTQSLLDASFRIQRKHFYHFLPAFIYFIYSLVIFITDKIILKASYFYANGHDKDLDTWYQILGLFAMVIYFGLSIQHYYSYKKMIYDNVSFADRLLFSWIKKYLIAFLCMQLLRIVFLVIYPDWGNFNEKGWYFLCFSILFFYIAINALLNEVKAITLSKLNKNSNEINSNEANDALINDWKKKITDHIITNKSFENPELTLADVAESLQTNATVISKTINKAYKMNFNDYINNLRIDAIKIKLLNKEYEKHTILSIALDCGFNSKTTFNRAFKKITLKTPKEFIAHIEK